MRDALQVARTAHLGKPVYGRPHPRARECWHIPKNGGDYFEWCWHATSNGCWKRRSTLPLFDDHKILAIA